MRFLSISILLLIFSGMVLAHPSLTPHENSAATIQWEQDGTTNGSTAHNHHSANDFNGINSTAEPFSAFHCWDNRTDRLDQNGAFNNGHCFIDEANTNSVVRYRFTGTGWPAAARDRVREAFAAFSAVGATGINESGVQFAEVTGTAELDIEWVNIPDTSGGGRYQFVNRELEMDSSFNWFFNRSPAGIANGQWHFHSVVLHEIGHAVGFAHQSDLDLMDPTVGQPPEIAGARYFMGLDGDTIEGVRSLYSQPEANDCEAAITEGTWTTNTSSQINPLYTVNGIWSSFSSVNVTVSHPFATTFQWQQVSGDANWNTSNNGRNMTFTRGSATNTTFHLTANTSCGNQTRTITFYWF